MLIDPASKVSVPLRVVMRTRSRAPERAGELPAVKLLAVVPLVKAVVPEKHHVFDPKKAKLIIPDCTFIALPLRATISPVVMTPDARVPDVDWLE